MATHQKPLPYIAPKLRVVAVEQLGDRYRLVGQFDRVDRSGPLAPAGLYTNERSGNEDWQLHKAVTEEGNVITFETYGIQAKPAPVVGQTYSYRGWWVNG